MELSIIHERIHEIKGKKVILDKDLAELYGVETRVLNKLFEEIFNVSQRILCLR